MALVIGIIGGVSESRFVKAFINGAADMMSVVLIIALARSITVLMGETGLDMWILENAANALCRLVGDHLRAACRSCCTSCSRSSSRPLRAWRPCPCPSWARWRHQLGFSPDDHDHDLQRRQRPGEPVHPDQRRHHGRSCAREDRVLDLAQVLPPSVPCAEGATLYVPGPARCQACGARRFAESGFVPHAKASTFGHFKPSQGFDNDKYLSMQSEHIRERITSSATSSIWNSAASCSTTTTPPACSRASSPTPSSACSMQLKDRPRWSSSSSANDIEKNKVRGDLGHHLRRGRAAPHRRLPLQGLRGQRVRHPVRAPAVEAFEKRLNSWASAATATTPSPATPTTSPTSSATRGTARTSTSRPRAPSWSSRRPAPAAARWPPAFPSCTTSTSAASRPVTPSSRPSPSGTCPSSTR